MPLQLHIVPDPAGLDLTALHKAVAVLKKRVSRVGKVNLKFIDDAEMAALNRKYSGQDYPTDVLSFDYTGQDVFAGDDLGDVAINWQAAVRQAEELGVSAEEEFALLAVHGILHLLGYDHQNQAESRVMDKLQKQIMTEADLNYRDFQWKH